MKEISEDLLWATSPQRGKAHVVEGHKPRSIRPRNENVYVGVSALCANHVDDPFHEFEDFDDINDEVELCQMCQDLVENERGTAEPFSNV